MRGTPVVPRADQLPTAGSYSSHSAGPAVAGYPVSTIASMTSTRPSSSATAWCCQRASCIDPVAVQLPVAGSYSSAEERVSGASAERMRSPPATSTRPSGSSVAEWPYRSPVMPPVGDQPPVAGSYNSAEESPPLAYDCPSVTPPATSTRPSASTVAVCSRRPMPSGAAADQSPTAGSYSAVSATAVSRLSQPPTASTRPSCSSTGPSNRPCHRISIGSARAAARRLTGAEDGVVTVTGSPAPGSGASMVMTYLLSGQRRHPGRGPKNAEWGGRGVPGVEAGASGGSRLSC